MKHKNKKTKKEPTQLQLANRHMKKYIQASALKAQITEAQKQMKERILAFASENPDLYDKDNNLHLRGGYVHNGNKTIIKPCEGFSFSKFVADFPELVDNKFKVSPMKALLNSEEGRKKLLENHCVELRDEEDVEIVIDKKS